MTRDNVLLHPPEVPDLHRGAQGRGPPELYLRPRDAQSEERWVREMLPDSSDGVPCGRRRSGLRRLLSSSTQQPGGSAGVAGGKIR